MTNDRLLEGYLSSLRASLKALYSSSLTVSRARFYLSSVICHIIRRQPNEVSDLDGSRRRLTEKIHSKINSSIVVSSVGRQRLQRFFPALQRDLIGGSDDTASTRCSVTKSQGSIRTAS